jgi:hypothetical protein
MHRRGDSDPEGLSARRFIERQNSEAEVPEASKRWRRRRHE